jgi:hypothetical protein
MRFEKKEEREKKKSTKDLCYLALIEAISSKCSGEIKTIAGKRLEDKPETFASKYFNF